MRQSKAGGAGGGRWGRRPEVEAPGSRIENGLKTSCTIVPPGIKSEAQTRERGQETFTGSHRKSQWSLDLLCHRPLVFEVASGPPGANLSQGADPIVAALEKERTGAYRDHDPPR